MRQAETSEELEAIGAGLARPRWLPARFVNTFLQLPWLWRYVVSDRMASDILADRFYGPSYRAQRVLQKLFWFWPRLIDVKQWVETVPERMRPTAPFEELDFSSKLFCDSIEKYAIDKGAPILDLGCNAGRHINNLHSRGFTNLFGVDAMESALDRMATAFPDAHRDANLRHALFQAYLLETQDKSFDVVYTYGATIELVHPSFDIVKEISRVCRKYFIFVHSETGGNGYPRFWEHEFGRNGFHLHACERPMGARRDREHHPDLKNKSLLIFERHR